MQSKIQLLLLLLAASRIHCDVIDDNKRDFEICELSYNRTGDSHENAIGFLYDTCGIKNHTNVLRVDYLVQKSDREIIDKSEFKGEVPKSVDVLDLWNKFPVLFVPAVDAQKECLEDSARIISAAKSMKLWALKMLDSSAKMPSGILNGNINQYGDFDQCLSIKQPIRAKYCLAAIDISIKTISIEIDSLIHSHHWIRSNISDVGHRVPKVSSINWGVCLPSSCSAEDLQKNLERSLKPFNAKVSVDEKLCVVEEEDASYSTGKIITILFFITIIICVVIGTIIDSKDVKTNHLLQDKISTIVKEFSLIKNFKSLLTINSNEGVPGLDGIRALNALGLIVSHKSVALFFNPYINRTFMAESCSRPWGIMGRTAVVYTDSFMLISGFLNAKNLLKDLHERGKMNVRRKLITRLFRILPSLIAVILFCTYILPDLGNGPQWEMVIKEHSRFCKKSMWRNLLFIHNFEGFETMCLTHTHQLGIDMQLFIVTPLAISLLWKYGSYGVYALLAISISSTMLRYFTALSRNISLVVYNGMPVMKFFESAKYSYILPTHRATIYTIGILLAYFMSKKGSKMHLSKIHASIGWIIAVGLGLLALLGPMKMALQGYTLNIAEVAYYNALSPIIWGAFISWMIWACSNNCGGWYQDFLSWWGFKIFTKIALGVYLIQFPVFFYNVGNQRHADYFKMNMVFDVQEVCFILGASVLLALFIEMPFNRIQKKIFENSPNASAAIDEKNLAETTEIDHKKDIF